ncbi:hypothetical protein [Streptosporangium sp. NPDC051022]|uniref:hypothetical protein n=1 Tax=Streptosporangium sp. NPDC051022 TaxID=3155752 RepID=UPI00341E71EC
MDKSEAQLHQDWLEAWNALNGFLDDIGATNEAHTVTLRLIACRIESPTHFIDSLQSQVSRDETWAFISTSPDDSGEQYAYALPVAHWRPQDAYSILFVEIHTVLVAWWLTTAWRARQLARAAMALTEAHDVIAAAACVRPLIETAAAHWVDGRKLVAAWDAMKSAGHPLTDADAFKRRGTLMAILNEVIFGAKFDNRAPELQRLWGRFQRSNVLGQVEKLAKVTSGDLQSAYQWLCNTVHPSIGNSFAFSAPPLVHDTRTHMMTWFAGRPIHIKNGRENHAERTVQAATAEGATIALKVLRNCLDASLRMIDDVALTTGAPDVANEQYWRNIRPVDRNKICPCRSGLKAKRCPHKWGDYTPSFPAIFQ